MKPSTTQKHAPQTSFRLYIRTLRRVQPYWHIVLIAALSAQLAALTQPLFAWVIGPLININFVAQSAAALPGPLQTLASYLGLNDPKQTTHINHLFLPSMIVVLFFFRGACNLIADYLSEWAATRVVFDLRTAIFDKLLHLPTAYYDEHSSSQMATRPLYDVSQVTHASINLFMAVMKDTAAITGQIVLMASINWRLMGIVLIAFPAAMLSMRWAGRRLRKISRDQQTAMADLADVFHEAIHGHKIVKVFGGQNYEKARLSERANHVRRLAVKQTITSSSNASVIQFLMALALAPVIYLASIPSTLSSINAGDFVSFIAAMLMLSPPLQRLGRINDALQKGLAAAESIFGFLNEPVETNAATAPKKDPIPAVEPTKRGHLKWVNVSFYYPGRPTAALKNVNLEVHIGETLAIVGTSGSGKTTLAHLLPRFYDPQQGEIYLDGVPLTQQPLAELRRQISWVSQDITMFNDTILANMTYGLKTFSMADVERVATAAHALEFIQALPEGFLTAVGERGIRLSGGQKQRLAIARALLKNAPLLILDEATSALDNESEKQVQQALSQLVAERTTLIIAHRLSTIVAASRIVVMQQGQIVEWGTHTSLSQQRGVYAQLWNLHQTEPIPGSLRP